MQFEHGGLESLDVGKEILDRMSFLVGSRHDCRCFWEISVEVCATGRVSVGSRVLTSRADIDGQTDGRAR